MRRLSALASIVLVGCGIASGQGSARVVGGAVCVDASDTVDLAPGQQGRHGDELPGCLTWPRSEVVGSATRGMCGPCGYVFDRATTLRERAGHASACCYSVSSPPPPPPPG